MIEVTQEQRELGRANRAARKAAKRQAKLAIQDRAATKKARKWIAYVKIAKKRRDKAHEHYEKVVHDEETYQLLINTIYADDSAKFDNDPAIQELRGEIAKLTDQRIYLNKRRIILSHNDCFLWNKYSNTFSHSKLKNASVEEVFKLQKECDALQDQIDKLKEQLDILAAVDLRSSHRMMMESNQRMYIAKDSLDEALTRLKAAEERAAFARNFLTDIGETP